MIDTFWWYTATLIFVCVIGSLFCVYRYYLGNKLTAQANKLKSMMANIKQIMPEIEGKSSDIVARGLGDIGIDGILSELGIPSIFAPMIKGFISNPDNIKKLMPMLEKMGLNLKQKEGKTVDNAEEGLL